MDFSPARTWLGIYAAKALARKLLLSYGGRQSNLGFVRMPDGLS